MNSLSWLLYWADVSDRLGTFLGAVSVTTIVIGLTALVVLSVARSDAYREDKATFAGYQKKVLYIGIPVVLVTGFVSTFMPSKQTIYLIAGSEIGERAIQTPEFNKVRRVVNDFLDDKIKTEDSSSDTEKKEEN